MNFTKYACPVCEENFKNDDDIVVCPECGTPHHRECFSKNGKCFNFEKHGTEETVELKTSDNIGTEEAPVSEEPEKEKISDNEIQGAINEIINEIQEKKSDEYLLDGVPASHFEAALGKNQKYYIPRFMISEKLKKPVSWNVGAFICPLAWTLYRKMYKFSALIFTLYVLLIGVLAFPVLSNEEFFIAKEECMAEDPEYATKIMMYISGTYDGTLTPAQSELAEMMENLEMPVALTVFRYVITFGARIIMGLFGTNLYYKKLKKNILSVKDAGFTPDSLKAYLFKKYGTIPFIIPAVIGFFEFYMF